MAGESAPLEVGSKERLWTTCCLNVYEAIAYAIKDFHLIMRDRIVMS